MKKTLMIVFICVPIACLFAWLFYLAYNLTHAGHMSSDWKVVSWVIFGYLIVGCGFAMYDFYGMLMDDNPDFHFLKKLLSIPIMPAIMIGWPIAAYGLASRR